MTQITALYLDDKIALSAINKLEHVRVFCFVGENEKEIGEEVKHTRRYLYRL